MSCVSDLVKEVCGAPTLRLGSQDGGVLNSEVMALIEELEPSTAKRSKLDMPSLDGASNLCSNISECSYSGFSEPPRVISPLPNSDDEFQTGAVSTVGGKKRTATTTKKQKKKTSTRDQPTARRHRKDAAAPNSEDEFEPSGSISTVGGKKTSTTSTTSRRRKDVTTTTKAADSKAKGKKPRKPRGSKAKESSDVPTAAPEIQWKLVPITLPPMEARVPRVAPPARTVEDGGSSVARVETDDADEFECFSQPAQRNALRSWQDLYKKLKGEYEVEERSLEARDVEISEVERDIANLQKKLAMLKDSRDHHIANFQRSKRKLEALRNVFNN